MTMMTGIAFVLSMSLFQLPVHGSTTQDTGSDEGISRKGGFDVPEYRGVEQLLVLSNRWVIVVTNNVEEVVRKIDELSGGAYGAALAAWKASQAVGMHPDWAAYKRIPGIRDKYIAKARELTGERDFEDPDYYRICSTDDTKYTMEDYVAELRPSRAGHVLVSLGGQEVEGGPDVHYAHYSYLEMPFPLQNGKHYTIRLANGKQVNFLYDEMRTVSRAIKINQIGYLPDAPAKYAYLGCYLYKFGPMDFSTVGEFKIVSAETGQTVYSGAIRPREKNARLPLKPGDTAGSAEPRPFLTGEDVYEMDFTDFTLEGDFFLSIPGVGRSWPFRHARDAYGEAFYTAARGLYHQRCGMAYEAPYTPWKRIKCHTAPIYESEYVAFGIGNFNAPKDYSRFDIIGATTDTGRKTENVSGGWHDAADWDRNIAHFTVILDLLNAYEFAPAHYCDGQLNLPESGNGIPDILDEADWGLKVWTRSMDGNGGVSGAVETYTHAPLEADVNYAFSRRTRWSSLVYAAAAAQMAQLLKPFDAARSEEYEKLAKMAYAFGNNPQNSLGKITIPAARDRGRGAKYSFDWEEKDEFVIPYLLLARVRLFVLSGDKAYLDGVANLMKDFPPPYRHPFTYSDYSPWFCFALAGERSKILPEPEATQLRKAFFLDPADELVGMVDQMPYRCTWPPARDYWMSWGTTVMTNQARCLWIAHALTGDEKYRRAAILNTDFMLGANPMGMSWTTGVGHAYPVNIQHEVSATDGIADPVPGITVYGITEGVFRELRQNVWQSPTDASRREYVSFTNPEVPVWRRWSCHPTMNTGQCEFTIQETMSSTIFGCAQLLEDGWKPPKGLKDRKPTKKESLFGYWYLP
jgi:hypothetical protein